MAMSSNADHYAYSHAYMHMDPSMTAMAYHTEKHKDTTTYVHIEAQLNAYRHTRFHADLCGK